MAVISKTGQVKMRTTDCQPNRLRRTFLLVLLAIGCLAGCTSRSPVKLALKEAQAWRQVAQQLGETDAATFENDLDKILHPVRGSEWAGSLRRLAERTGDIRETRMWLIGRAYLCSGTAYLIAARAALMEGRLDDTRQFCLFASESFSAAAQRLPDWERESVHRWAGRLRTIAAKLNDQPFYALTHLTAMLEKAKAHAKFVPPR